MFDGQNRGASVYAQVFSKLLIIPKHVIEQLMNKELLLQFIKNLHTQTITNLTKVNTKAIELGAVDNYFF